MTRSWRGRGGAVCSSAVMREATSDELSRQQVDCCPAPPLLLVLLSLCHPPPPTQNLFANPIPIQASTLLLASPHAPRPRRRRSGGASGSTNKQTRRSPTPEQQLCRDDAQPRQAHGKATPARVATSRGAPGARQWTQHAGASSKGRRACRCQLPPQCAQTRAPGCGPPANRGERVSDGESRPQR